MHGMNSAISKPRLLLTPCNPASSEKKKEYALDEICRHRDFRFHDGTQDYRIKATMYCDGPQKCFISSLPMRKRNSFFVEKHQGKYCAVSCAAAALLLLLLLLRKQHLQKKVHTEEFEASAAPGNFQRLTRQRKSSALSCSSP